MGLKLLTHAPPAFSTPSANRTRVGLKHDEGDGADRGGDGANRTRVGLKRRRTPTPPQPRRGANRTRVGLKPHTRRMPNNTPARANRTRVGLKLAGRFVGLIEEEVLIEPGWD